MKHFLSATAMVGMAGCAVSVDPFSEDELKFLTENRLSSYTANQEAVTRPISLYEAMARAVKYNLDYKAELYEEALQANELNLVSFDAFP